MQSKKAQDAIKKSIRRLGPKIPVRLCDYCKQEFQPRQDDQIFCDSICRSLGLSHDP